MQYQIYYFFNIDNIIICNIEIFLIFADLL